MSKQEQKIKEGAKPFLEAGEEVLAAIVAAPRGHTQAVAGAQGLGQRQEGRVRDAAEQAGVQLASPMAVALTQKRLLTLSIGAPIGLGIGGKVKDVLSSVPIAEVDSIEVKRLGLGKKVILTVRSVPITLEANAAANANDLAEAFERAKAGLA